MNLQKILFLIVLVSFSSTYANAVTFESGVQQTVMIELYTSEGCSSCPPAEKYLNEFKNNSTLWKKYIPLAFHVDYWDYIGWKDRFARPAHTERQRSHARENRAHTIYTPGFFVNGRTWRRGFFGSSMPETKKVQAGKLVVRYVDGLVDATFTPVIDTDRSVVLNLAVLGMGLTTDIRAGENAGRHSSHDFVVLGHRTVTGNGPHWQISLPALLPEVRAASHALVAWVSDQDRPAPLQATGGYIDISDQK